MRENPVPFHGNVPDGFHFNRVLVEFARGAELGQRPLEIKVH
jgi:hypothetical protein